MSGIMQEKNRVVGSTLLVAGTCMGAGMLGLPIITGVAGFSPSIFLLVASWMFMCVTGLLLLEVNLWFRDDVSLISMAEKTLGPLGKGLMWGLFLFLFYSLMVGYLTASGSLIVDCLEDLFGLSLADGLGNLFSAILFGSFVYLGVKGVDSCNRWMMFGLVVSYFLLVGLGAKHVKMERLSYVDAGAVPFIVPAMIISFGYHNLIPSLTAYLKHDKRQIQVSIIVGSAIALLIYVVWEWVLLGIIPVEGVGGIREALGESSLVTKALQRSVGASWVVDVARAFAFFAIVTSLLGVALSFVDFFADGLHWKKDVKGRVCLTMLVFVPPLLFSWVYPKLFLRAIQYAGAYGAVLLYGILPALMVWSGRYRLLMTKNVIVKGGKPLLLFVILFACSVVVLEMIR